VVAQAKKFVPVKIDANADQKTADRYKIESVPTILFLTPDGKELRRFVGFKPPQEFLKEMNAVKWTAKKTTKPARRR
jgi:thioredoxin-related protein